MRIAAMVLGLMLSAWAFFEGFLINALSFGNEAYREMAGEGAATGIFGGLVAAFAIPLPLVSTILFPLVAAASFATASGGYENHWVYGSIYLVLAVMTFFGWIGKRRDRHREQLRERAQAERDARYEALLAAQQRPQAYPAQAVECPSCHRQNPAGTKFCAECGTRIAFPAYGSS